MEGNDNQVLCKLNCDVELENWCTPEGESKGVFLFLPGWKLLLVGLMNMYGGKCCARVIAGKWIPGDM